MPDLADGDIRQQEARAYPAQYESNAHSRSLPWSGRAASFIRDVTNSCTVVQELSRRGERLFK
jgi:hypothetical protein